jgi:hypothetical protein
MDNESKELYDRLLQAEWIDNVRDTVVSERKGVHVHQLSLRKLHDPAEYGVYKVVIFSKLFRELTRAGKMSPAELALIVKMGQMFAIQHGFEKA